MVSVRVRQEAHDRTSAQESSVRFVRHGNHVVLCTGSILYCRGRRMGISSTDNTEDRVRHMHIHIDVCLGLPSFPERLVVACDRSTLIKSLNRPLRVESILTQSGRLDSLTTSR